MIELKDQVKVTLTQIEVVQLAPLVTDERGNPEPESAKPNWGRPLSPFVEEDPHTNKIAHRELKVRIGSPAMSGKKVIWKLIDLPSATPATIRGKWSDSKIDAHQNAFEKSATFGKYGFDNLSGTGKDAIAETTVGPDGHTAIRVNVPPIGFNQVRIQIQVEGIDQPFNLIDMEVPAVVVIDPGHGGKDSGSVSQDKNTKEADLVFPYASQLKQQIIRKFASEKRGLRLYLSREDNEYVENLQRATDAGNAGADLFLSIHFNAPPRKLDPNTIRGTEYCNRSTGQVNEADDTKFGVAVQKATLKAVEDSDTEAKHRDVKLNDYAVLSDFYYGNTSEYSPLRGTIIEVEFITHPKALETVKLSNASGLAVMNKFSIDVANVIFHNIIQHK